MFWNRRRPCGFSALCESRARHTPGDWCHGSHRLGPGHSPRSLFRAAFRYPLDRTLSRPGRAEFEFGPATLMGFFVPFAVFLVPRVPAFLRFIPTCRYPNRSRASPLIFTGCRSPLCKTPSKEFRGIQTNEFQNGTDDANHPTGFWVMLPRTSRTGIE